MSWTRRGDRGKGLRRVESADDLAMLVVSGRDRAEAVASLARAVNEFGVEGIDTSLAFHRQLVQHPVFLQGRYDTGFIGAHLKPPKEERKAR